MTPEEILDEEERRIFAHAAVLYDREQRQWAPDEHGTLLPPFPHQGPFWHPGCGGPFVDFRFSKDPIHRGVTFKCQECGLGFRQAWNAEGTRWTPEPA